MASRLGYAVAFAAVRNVLVLDELLAVGDAGFKERCFERYRELRAGGHTFLLVSHDPGIVAACCDRAVLLEGGAFLWRVLRPALPTSMYRCWRLRPHLWRGNRLSMSDGRCMCTSSALRSSRRVQRLQETRRAGWPPARWRVPRIAWRRSSPEASGTHQMLFEAQRPSTDPH